VEPHFEAVAVRARGVLDAAAADQLDACLQSLWDVGLRRLRVDLSGIETMGAEGRATVGRWARQVSVRTPAEPVQPSLP
jgi:anti-anti-sigma regulatory factor